MKKLYLLSLAVFLTLTPLKSNVAHPGGQEASGGRIDRDVVGGAALIFRRPENPNSGAGGVRIGSGRDKPFAHPTQDQMIAKGNAARSAHTPRYAEAEGQYKMAAQMDPKDHRAFAGLGNVYLDQGRYSD